MQSENREKCENVGKKADDERAVREMYERLFLIAGRFNTAEYGTALSIWHVSARSQMLQLLNIVEMTKKRKGECY